MDLKIYKKRVLKLLEETKFPKCITRKNVSKEPTESFALGMINYRGQKFLDGKVKGPSRYNSKYPELYEELCNLINISKPDFKYTTIQVNKNVVSNPHVDKNNVGPSYIIALGDFSGGKLVIEGDEYNIKNRWKNFDGKLGHWITPFLGTRYSLVYFTHTFKPPCPSLRNIIVTTDGLYKKGEKIKNYK